MKIGIFWLDIFYFYLPYFSYFWPLIIKMMKIEKKRDFRLG